MQMEMLMLESGSSPNAPGTVEQSTAVLAAQKLVLIPALITLAVTVVRLAGELLHGPRALFNSEAGGAWAIVGIIWLAPVFGVYFALKLAARGNAPQSLWRAIAFSLLGVAVVFALGFWGSRLNLAQHFRERLVYVWAVMAVAALVTRWGWAKLFRTLLVYAYTARLPVAVVMLLAFWRDWGTHYDAVPSEFPEGVGLLAKYLWLGFFPQLIFWVGATVLLGMLAGSFAVGIAHVVRRRPQVPS